MVMKIALIGIGIAIIGALFIMQDFGSQIAPEPEQPIIKRAVDVESTSSQQTSQQSTQNIPQSKYDGLTENQILKVKIIEESCASKTKEAEVTVGATFAKDYEEKCEDSVLKMIEGYKKDNSP